MKFEDILSNTKLTYFIIYIFIVLGSLVTLFCKSNNYIIFLLGILLLPNSCLILTIIYDKKLKNKNKAFFIKFIRVYKIIGGLSLILIPTLLSFNFINNIKNPTILTYIITLILSYTTSLITTMNLRERLIVNKKLDDTENLKSGLIILFSLFITLIINEYSNIISETINELIHNITNITTISLAIVMLCATLSALTFTYYTTTDKNEKVKKNGQYYFISTILSMALTVLIFLLTTFAPLITNLNVTHITLKSNIILSAYTFFIIITFILLIYTAYYLIIPSIKTLMILGFIKKESLTWKLIKKLIKIKKNNWWVTISIKHEK